MPIKDHAEFQIRAYTSEFIPKITSHHFSIADVFQDLVFRDRGEGTRLEQDDETPPEQWQKQPEFNRIDPNIVAVFLGDRVYFGAEAIRAAHEAKASSSAVFGFTLKPARHEQNCKMMEGLPGEPAPAKGYGTLRWRALKGRTVNGASRWETYRPQRFPGTTYITHTVQTPDEVVEAQTIETLPANAAFAVTLLWRGVAEAQTKVAAFRLMWGAGALSIVFRHGGVPTVERFENSKWQVWKTLEGVPDATFQNNTQTRIRVLRIAGRLVVGIDDRFFELLDSTKAPGSGRGEGYALRDAQWQRGGLRVRAFGVSVMVGVSKLLYLDALDKGDVSPSKAAPAGFRPRQGQIERDVSRPGLTPRMDEDAALGQGSAGGWPKGGTRITVETQVLTDAVRYVCTLRASLDGISAPFTNKVMARYLGLFSAENAPYLDFAKACVSGSETSAFPPLAPGAEWSLEVDRSVLDLLDANWRDYIKQFNPVEILVRWKYTDGTYSPWVGRFKGYISVVSMKVAGANKWTMTLQLRDPIMRLQKRHAVVDHNYYPLDLLYAQGGLSASGSSGQSSKKPGDPLFGWECVKEILSIALGEDEGNRLNVQLPPFHYSLLSGTTDTCGYLSTPFTAPPTGNGFKLPPPWWRAPFDWIQNFAKMDYALFFYGYPTGTFGTSQTVEGANGGGEVAWPVPIYGQYPLIIKNRPTWVVPDDNYQSGDMNLLAFMGEVTGLPEENINRIVVAGTAFQGGADLPFPSLHLAERLLDDDDPNAAKFSWVRTLVHTGPQYSFPGAADVHAERVMALYRNKKIRRYKFECRGEERMQWGDLVQPQMQNAGGSGSYSDPHLDVHGEKFRIWRLQNTFRFHERGPEQFKTSATCLPVSALGY